jgi:hypothetical protein
MTGWCIQALALKPIRQNRGLKSLAVRRHDLGRMRNFGEQRQERVCIMLGQSQGPSANPVCLLQHGMSIFMHPLGIDHTGDYEGT